MAEFFKTQGQLDMNDAFNYAVKNQCKVMVIDQAGSGFKHALKHFMAGAGFTKVVYADIQYQQKINEISVEMFRELMQLKFSNLNYKKVALQDLVRVLGNRVKQDLKGRKILVVFDHFDKLKSMPKIESFLRLLSCVNFKCGIVLRTSISHLNSIKQADESMYAKIMLLTERKVPKKVGKHDISLLCRSCGLKDLNLIDEISSKTTNFRLAMAYIKKYKHLTEIESTQLVFNFDVI